jgi:ACS family hexuronate transporter-like MFS transporter
MLATMLNYMDRQTVSLSVERLYAEFGRSPESYGNTEAVFALAFALGSFISGMIVDRYGVYWVYPGAVVVWSAAGFLTGFASNWDELMACRFLLGFSEAAHWPCALRTTQHILAPQQRSLGNGILQSGAAIGAIITPLIVLLLVTDPSRWRYPFWVIGILGLSWVWLWHEVVGRNDLPGAATANRVKEKEVGGSPGLSFLRVLASREFVVLVVLVITINAAWHFFRAWLTSFLHDIGYKEQDAILFNSAYYMAADAGSLSVGFVTLYVIRLGMSVHRARMLTFLLCALLVALSTMVPLLDRGWLQLGMLLVIGFGALGLFPTYYSFGQELSVRHQGTVVGLLGCITWLSIALMQSEVGKAVQETGSHTRGMQSIGLAPLIGFAVLLLLWRNNKECLNAKANSSATS